MIKISVFKGSDDVGQIVFPIFHSAQADREFEKKAEAIILPDVAKYIARLKPIEGAQYVLVNAMGAGEFYGSNINGDHFPEAGLIHCPDRWYGVPDIDKLVGKDWAYGFPTFYNAHPFLHHHNKDATRAYGEIELTTWNPKMRRVELVIRVDKDMCEKYGGTNIWDKLKMGQYPDVSMGSRVPFDTCSICLDWDLYRKAQATFDPKKHKHPGEAVLAFHRDLIKTRGHGIRGLAITRKDYCEHAAKNMNKILPDGRKIFVYNDYPRFFDISFVFIGADKTAKVMMKVAEDSRIWSLPSAYLAEHLGYEEKDAYVVPAAGTGLKRVGQLLSGSHVKTLETAGANFNPKKVIKDLNAQRVAKGEGEGGFHAMMADARNHGKDLGNALDTERSAVRKTRIGAGVAGAVGTAGLGAMALSNSPPPPVPQVKIASADEILKEAFLGKSARIHKDAEIEKHGPTQFDSKAVPVLTRSEPHLSHDVIDEMCEHPLDDILASHTSMGIVLRPREFQRIVVIKMGLRPLADDMDEKDVVFPRVESRQGGHAMGRVLPQILSMLSSLFTERSALTPALDKRITLMVQGHGEEEHKKASSHPTNLLNKIGAAYTSYRQGVMNYWMQDRQAQLEKTASSLSTHTFEYLKHAFWNEVGGQ